MAAVCGKCRTHVHLKIDYSDGWQSKPCPNTENPLHHFVRAKWREDTERRAFAKTMLGSPVEITVFQCSAPGCSATLTVQYTPPVLSDEIVHTLTDRDVLQQRTEAAFKLSEGNTQGMKPPAIIDVLSDLRIYLANAWNKEQVRRDIKMSNKRFIVRFGPNGDACKDILETLRFRRDSQNQCWHVPEPNAEDTLPIQDPLNIFLDDAEHELLALMVSRPPEEVHSLPDIRPGPSATRDLQRLLSAQDYDTTLFSRTSKTDPAQRPTMYVGLGIVPDAADLLVRYAYERQIASDQINIPYYFGFLRDVALERRSEVLQTKVGMEESIGRFSAQALELAFSSFGISRQDNLDDDNIIGMFQARLTDMPNHESELRQSLRIVGNWRQSSKILAVADNGKP
jgi:ubiquitin carboxyl-terminal hydrolase 25